MHLSSIRFRGAASRKTIAIVVLVAVIVVSMVYNLIQLFSSSTPPRVVSLEFQCIQCKAQFAATNQDIQNQGIDRPTLKQHTDRTFDQPHCPQCGAKHAGVAMMICPNCEKPFLPAPVNVRRLPEGTPPLDPTCPHCNTNLRKWREEHR